jgi:tetratricopeptide (TPR) repeat protein
MLRRILTSLASAFGVLLSAVLVDPAKDFIKDLVKQHHFLDQAWAHISGHPFWLGLGFVVLALAAVADWFINPSEPTDAKQSSSITGSGNRVVQAGSGAKVEIGSHNLAVEGNRTNIQHYHEAQRVERVVPMQIEAPPPDFTGRDELVAELVATLRKGGNASITGISGLGGIGKTALARAVAAELKAEFPDGQINLDLKGALHKDDVPGTQPLSSEEALMHVITSFGHEIQVNATLNDRTALYRSILHGKRVLLLMDNARDAAQVDPLRPPPGCAMVVSSRQDFVLDWLQLRHLDVLEPDKACGLLVEITPRIEANAAEVASLCGYLPLALRTVAATLKVRTNLTPKELLQRMSNSAARLKESGVTLALTTSADLLPENLRQLWHQLGVFPDTFDEPAAAAVLELEPDATKDALGDLLSYSVVEFDATTSRYRLHDLVRDFTVAHLDAATRAAAQLRHATHYKDVIRAATALYRSGGDNVVAGLRRFDLEWGNIRVGQDWAVTQPRTDRTAARLMIDYSDAGVSVLPLRLHPRALIDWLQASAAAAVRLGDRPAEGRTLGNRGLAHFALGEYRRAIEFHEQHLVIAREFGDRRGEGNALANLGNAHHALGEYRRAIEFHEQHLVIARAIGNRQGEGNALGSLGLDYYSLGEYCRAIQFHEQHLVITREFGDRLNEGRALGNLGLGYYALGEYRRAILFLKQRLVIAREIGDRLGEGDALYYSADTLDKLSNRDEAIRRLQAALAIYEQIESPRAEWARQQLAEWRSG